MKKYGCVVPMLPQQAAGESNVFATAGLKARSQMSNAKQTVEENHAQTVLVIDVTSGKNSTRMLGYLRSRFPHILTYCVMADTGFEHVRPLRTSHG